MDGFKSQTEGHLFAAFGGRVFFFHTRAAWGIGTMGRKQVLDLALILIV